MGLIYTMNIPTEMMQTMGYDVSFGRTRATLEREFGSCKMIMANNTKQYDDYSKYKANAPGEEKQAYKDAHFSEDCQQARLLGEQPASGKVFKN